MFGPDDDRLVFRMDSTGVMQFWELDRPKSWPHQRTFTDEGVQFGAWSPTGEELVFGRDAGGDERTQLYLLDDETGDVTQLTDEPSAVHRWGCWSPDGESVAYAANRDRPGVFDIYVQGRDEDDPHRIYEQDKPSAVVPVSWSPDGQLLVLEVHSSFNRDVHLIDVTTGEAQLLTEGHETPVRYQSVTWGPDGDSLYLVTDREYNWLYVARLDLETLEVEPVIRTDADIKSMVLNSSCRWIAYLRYENGYTDVRAGDLVDETAVEEFPAPDFPEGTAENLTMSSDGEQLATVFSTGDTKPDLYTVDVRTGETRQWTDCSTAVPEDAYVAPESVTYESFDGLAVPSFYVEPEAPDEEPMPAVIDLHGGPRSQYFPAISPVRQHYVDRGFVRLEPNYRGSSGYGKEYMAMDDVEKRLDAIRDVKAAAEWLADRDHVDEDCILLHGTSYGGFLVLAAMTRWPDLFAGGVAIAPITNFVTYLENTGPWRRRHREAEYGSLEDDEELLRELSPIHDVENVRAPLFVAHGKNDARVPVEEAIQIEERLEDEDVPVETLLVDDAGHHFGKKEHRVEVFQSAMSFLDDHL
jgi:dipeptidyl aminopeptidase/acylaminoacyl peptidase